MSRLSALRARHSDAHAQLVRRVVRAAAGVSRAVAGVWSKLLNVLRTTFGYQADRVRVLTVLQQVGPVTANAMQERLAPVYLKSHTEAVRVVPVEVLRKVPPDTIAPPPYDQVRAWLAQFVRPEDYALIGTDTDKRMPAQLAHEMAAAMSAGKTQYEVAKAIRPFLDGSRVRAARAARTFGLHVAGTAQREAWRSLGDMLIGYELIKTTVPDSRPWHIARIGRRYYFSPGPGQDGMAQCPHPPLEPLDPSERPAGAPKIAWNCLCALVPILR